MNTVIVGRIIIVAIVVAGFFWLDDFQEWQERSARAEYDRAAKAELRHLENQMERYNEILEEGGNPAIMFEIEEGRNDQYAGDTYGMP